MSNCFEKYRNYVSLCETYEQKLQEPDDRKIIRNLERTKAETLFNLQTSCPQTYDFFGCFISHVATNSERNFPKR